MTALQELATAHPLLVQDGPTFEPRRLTRVEVTVDGDGDVTEVVELDLETGARTFLWKRSKTPTCAALRKALEDKAPAKPPDYEHLLAVDTELIRLLRKRLEHVELELAQARASRDDWKAKFDAALADIEAVQK